MPPINLGGPKMPVQPDLFDVVGKSYLEMSDRELLDLKNNQDTSHEDKLTISNILSERTAAHAEEDRKSNFYQRGN